MGKFQGTACRDGNVMSKTSRGKEDRFREVEPKPNLPGSCKASTRGQKEGTRGSYGKRKKKKRYRSKFYTAAVRQGEQGRGLIGAAEYGKRESRAK